MTTIDFNRLNMRGRGRACICGSGDEAYEVLDSRGIYLALGCEKCLPARLESYRADVLYGPTYEADEPIEPEEEGPLPYYETISYGMDV